VPGIRKALREMKDGKGAVHTPENIAAYARKHQGNYEKRKIASGAQRIPGGLLSPQAARALDQLLVRGAASKAAAINHALIVAAG
jgi:hypothetical protein